MHARHLVAFGERACGAGLVDDLVCLMQQPARNSPCSCGSGRKYKHCCINATAAQPGALGPTTAELNRLISLANAGAFERLEADAAALARRYPASGLTWKLLGFALGRQGKDPLQALEHAARCLPNDAEAASNLGNAQRSAGNLTDALASHRRSLTLAPDYAPAHNNLGSVLQDLGQWQEAVQSFRAAAQLDPAFFQAHCNLGNALLELARPEEAAASYQRALLLEPDHLAALVPMGAALRDVGKIDLAAAAFRRALELKPSSAEIHYNLAVVLRLENRTADAESAARTALDLNPAFVAALVLLAKLQVDRGRFPEAEALLMRAIALEPDSPYAWSALPSLRRMTSTDVAWLTAAQRIAARPLPARQEVHLRYALGKYCDDVRDFPKAFDHYRRANELAKTYSPRHDRTQVTQFVERIIRTPLRFGQQRQPQGPVQKPVFIIGMPRSGTSLVEQIIASHSSVFGAGELPYWGKALSAWLPAGADPAAVPALARDYRRLLAALAGHAEWVLDKMPTNFLAAGLILEALPDARFIHMRRDPIDTCLSIYFQDFEAAYSYANDLSDLAHSYQEYTRLMDHWRACLHADTLLEVSYEELVADQEAGTRRMLEFLELPFEPACLDFHRTVRTVATVSSWQVRQSINPNSVARWRNYREFIGPLLTLNASPSTP